MRLHIQVKTIGATTSPKLCFRAENYLFVEALKLS